ncbi:MAG: hypothetical protein M3619_29650 [Myxococcota bacterium]|nr:hypothetical protein [Myxococcota bacterium]
MARVNLDGKVWKDPRVKRLAKRRTWSLRETIGTLAAVWDVAYDNKTPIMPRIDVDTAAESDNFAADMIAEDLATEVDEDLVMVSLRGVTERIQYLLAQADRGRKGGLARAAGAERDADGRLGSKRTPSERQANAKHPPALPLDLDPSQDPPPEKSVAADAAVLAAVAVGTIEGITGRTFRADSEVTLRPCRKLAKRRVAPEQLRAAILHVAQPWVGTKFEDKIRPATLLQFERVTAALDDLAAGNGNGPADRACLAPDDDDIANSIARGAA